MRVDISIEIGTTADAVASVEPAVCDICAIACRSTENATSNPSGVWSVRISSLAVPAACSSLQLPRRPDAARILLWRRPGVASSAVAGCTGPVASERHWSGEVHPLRSDRSRRLNDTLHGANVKLRTRSRRCGLTRATSASSNARALALSTGLTRPKGRASCQRCRGSPGEVAERPVPIRGRRPPCRLRDSGCPQPIRAARPRKCARALPP